MWNWTPTSLMALGLIGAFLIASCSADTTDEAEPVFPPAATTETSVPQATSPPATSPPVTTIPADAPLATEPERPGTVEVVPVTIQEIGVASVIGRDWLEQPDGSFTHQGATLGFGGIPTRDAQDFTALGFTTVEEHADQMPWSVYALDDGDMTVHLATTELAGITWVISLEAPRDLAETLVRTALVPAIEAFEVLDNSITLAANPPASPELSSVLDELVAQTGLPAVGVTLFDDDDILETAVAGVRRSGDPTAVELTDRFSIGSNAKAMTATLVATFVDEGALSFETTVAEVFGDAVPELDESLAPVTVRQLLSHTGGIDDERAIVYLDPLLGAEQTVAEERSAVVETALARGGHHPTGRYVYSNVGYTIAGAMLEQLTDSSWEDLMRSRIFDPLDMDSCGFYAPGTPGQVDQPWGHLDQRNGEPIDPGAADADLPHAIAPAGLVHCSMADWARFAQSQLRGFQGSESEIVSPEAFAAIRTPAEGSDYALGWVVGGDDADLTLYHQGSNLRFTAEVWLIPGENRGMLTVTNLGEAMATPLLDQVDAAMFARYGGADAAD